MGSQQLDITELAARLQRLEDIEAIKRQLINRVTDAADRGMDVDLAMSLYARDAVREGGLGRSRFEGLEAIREGHEKAASVMLWTLHYMMAPEIDVASDGRSAKARWHALALVNRRSEETGKEEALWVGGVYDSDCVKEDGQWKFKRVSVDFDLAAPYEEGWAGNRFRASQIRS
jgi:hypothetical protein